MQTFFNDDDYLAYIGIMSRMCTKYKVEIWAYCLMPNHVHLIAVPHASDSLAKAIGETHRSYTSMVNTREKWSGYLWQGRFASFPMDEAHLYLAARYIELNPVRAGLVKEPWEYRWSSAAAHINRRNDKLVKVKPLLDLFGDWKKYLSMELSLDESDKFRKHERTGRPLGSKEFLSKLEEELGQDLGPRKRGPKGPWKNK